MEYIFSKITALIALVKAMWAGEAGRVKSDSDHARVVADLNALRRAAENHGRLGFGLTMGEKQMRVILKRIHTVCKKHGWSMSDFSTPESPVRIQEWKDAIIAGPATRELVQREESRRGRDDDTDTGIHLIGIDADAARTKDKRDKQARALQRSSRRGHRPDGRDSLMPTG